MRGLDIPDEFVMATAQLRGKYRNLPFVGTYHARLLNADLPEPLRACVNDKTN